MLPKIFMNLCLFPRNAALWAMWIWKSHYTRHTTIILCLVSDFGAKPKNLRFYSRYIYVCLFRVCLWLLFSYFTRSKPKNCLTTAVDLRTLFSWNGQTQRRQTEVSRWKQASKQTLRASKCYALSSHPSYLELCTARSTCIAIGEFSMHVLLYTFSSLLLLAVRFSCIHSLVFTIIMWTFVPYTRRSIECICLERKE